MNFIAEIDIMPLKELLDPQGKAVQLGLGNLGITEVENVRIGKHITLQLNAENEEKAKEIVETTCKKLLANLIMEQYHFTLSVLEV
jgi:phosphoribosylformylglycinamidine synthase subunit PurS